MSSIIELKHVSRFYGTVIGVGDISLDLPAGGYGLVGPNGSGKTTFINLLTGALAPSLGSVQVFGKTPTRDRSILRRIGLCPASDILQQNVSAIEWVTFLTTLHGLNRTSARKAAVDALQKLGMSQGMHQPIGSYSLGMRQRTKLAQAIAHDPDLLILDEPFNGLDPIGRHELTEFLIDWIQSGKSLILASHVLHEVEAVTSAFLLIHGGRLLASGNANEVRSMLQGFPTEIRIEGKGLQCLASMVSSETWVQSLAFERAPDALTIRVADPAALLNCISELASNDEIEIQSMQSPDGTMESAFDLLLKVHRGELALI